MLTGERPFRGNTRMLLHQVSDGRCSQSPQPECINPQGPRHDLFEMPGEITGQALCNCRRLRRRPAESSRPQTDHRTTNRTESNDAWRWCKRKPVIAGLSAALLLAMSTGIGVSTYYAGSANQKAGDLTLAIA